MKNKSLIRIVILIMAFVAVMGILASVGKNVVDDNKNVTDTSGDVTSGKDTSSDVDTYVPTTEIVEPTETQEGHIHEFGDATVTKQATCIEEGEQTFVCISCNATKIESIAKSKQHKYNSSGSCTLCGSVCNHNWSKYVTSTIDGTKHIRQCFVCDAKETDLHYYTNGTCFVCDAECLHSSYIDAGKTDYESLNENEHSYKELRQCEVCKTSIKYDDGLYEAHKFVDDCCSLCGFFDVSKCAHLFYTISESVEILNEYSHIYVTELQCDKCGFNKTNTDDIRSHIFDVGTCHSCGFSCAHDGTSSGLCRICGLYLGSGYDPSPDDPDCDHVGYDTWSDGEHCSGWTQCTNCWAIIDSWHAPDDSNDDGICDWCGESA